MATLSHWRNRVPATIAGIVILLVAILAQGQGKINATSVHTYGWMTSYAMNLITGQCNCEVFQGYIANHSRYYCAGDPSSYWPFGTAIQLDPGYWMQIHDYYGNPINLTYFALEDTGDPYCTQGNYWLDGYMGRYSPSATPPSSYYWCNAPGYAYVGYHDSCVDAIYWGKYWVGYWASY